MAGNSARPPARFPERRLSVFVAVQAIWVSRLTFRRLHKGQHQRQ